MIIYLKRYYDYWTDVVTIESCLDEGVVALKKSGRIYRNILDDGMFNIDIVDGLANAYAAIDGLRYDISEITGIKDFEVKNGLVTVWSDADNKDLSEDTVVFRDPGVTDEDKIIFANMENIFKPEDLTKAEKNVYKRYFRSFGMSYKIYKDKRVNFIKPRKEPSEIAIKMAKEITEGIDSDYEKVKAISFWVADNVYYDWYYEENKTDTKLGDEKLIGICHDYAVFTQELINAIGIPCSYEKGVANTVFGLFPHAWNEAFVDGRWILIDNTWDSNNGYSSKTNIYTKEKPNVRFFDLPLEEFSKDHYTD